MAGSKTPGQQEFEAITRRAARRMKRQRVAVAARYDRRSAPVMITLNTGAVVGFPLSFLPGLDDLRKIEIEGGGYGLHVDEWNRCC